MKPSASKLGLLKACAYPFNGQMWPAQVSGDAADLGSAYHQVVARLVNIPGSDAHTHKADAAERYAVDPKALAALRPEDAAAECSSGARAEVAFAWNWETGKARELGVDLDRGYLVGDTEIAGTADIIDGDTIADWKTGKEPPKAEDNAQLLFLAMCANKLDYQISRVQIRHVHPDGEVWHDTAELGPFDLDAFEAELVGEIRSVNLAEPNPEKHCRYCPMVAVCPRTVAAIAEPEEAFPLALYQAADIQSAEHARWLLHRIDAAESLLSSVKGKVREYVDTHGHIELSDGKKWGPYLVSRETICGSREKLIEMGIPEDLIEYSVAKGDVEKYAKDGAEKGKGAAAVRAMIEKLRDAGCVKESSFTKYEARK